MKIMSRALALVLSSVLACPQSVLAGAVGKSFRLGSARSAAFVKPGSFTLPSGSFMAAGPESIPVVNVPLQTIAPAAPHPVAALLKELEKSGIPINAALSSPQEARDLFKSLQTLPDHSPIKKALSPALRSFGAAPAGADSGTPGGMSDQKPARSDEFFDGSPIHGQERLWSVWAAAASLRFLPASWRRSLAARASRAFGALKPAPPSEIAPEKLRWVPSPDILPASIRDIPAGEWDIIGQDQAVKEIEFGLTMKGDDYNLFVAGPEGSGRLTAALQIARKIAARMPTPPDMVAATNFDDPDHPIILKMPAGTGARFVADVENFQNKYPRAWQREFNSSALQGSFQALVNGYAKTIKSRLETAREAISRIRLLGGKFKLDIKADPSGLRLELMLVHLESGQAFPAMNLIAQLKESPKTRRDIGVSEEEVLQADQEIQDGLESWLSELRRVVNENVADMEKMGPQKTKLIRSAARGTALKLFREIMPALAARKDRGSRAAGRYVLSLAAETAAAYAAAFSSANPEGPPEAPEPVSRVSLIVDNSKTLGAPVVVSKAADFASLLGSANAGMHAISSVSGLAFAKDKSGPRLKSGDYLKADGGFLIIPLTLELLRQPNVWPALMRAVSTGELELGAAAPGERPVRVPAKVKVVLVGSPVLRSLLAQHDEVFAEHFKAAAYFDPDFKITPEAIQSYLRFFADAARAEGENILPPSPGAVAALLEAAARAVPSNQRFTSRFGLVHKLMREASHVAAMAGKAEFSPEDIQKAAEILNGGVDRIRRRIQDHIKDGRLIIHTDGKNFNMINGLMVLGDFGLPQRITAGVAPAGSKDGISVVLNDKEAGWTGRSMDKSAADIRGYLMNLYGRVPLDIRISFEQIPGGLDGDSATTAMDVLSRLSIAGIPVRQDGAVTGSADQLGAVQVIGGINHKIEGVFETMKNKDGGLKGAEFVVMPRANASDLMLDPEIVAAVREKKFRVYGVDGVDQVVEIFSGLPIERVRILEKLRLNEFAASNGLTRMFWGTLHRGVRALFLEMPGFDSGSLEAQAAPRAAAEFGVRD